MGGASICARVCVLILCRFEHLGVFDFTKNIAAQQLLCDHIGNLVWLVVHGAQSSQRNLREQAGIRSVRLFGFYVNRVRCSS